MPGLRHTLSGAQGRPGISGDMDGQPEHGQNPCSVLAQGEVEIDWLCGSIILFSAIFPQKN
jgi:hypothetical protein